MNVVVARSVFHDAINRFVYFDTKFVHFDTEMPHEHIRAFGWLDHTIKCHTNSIPFEKHGRSVAANNIEDQAKFKLSYSAAFVHASSACAWVHTNDF